MWVYGDRTRRVVPAALLAEVEADLAAGDRVSALIGLGQLAQGVADAAFEARGYDGRSPPVDRIMAALTRLSPHAHPLESGDPGVFAPFPHTALLAWPDPVEVRIPEGYAFYALHPALYTAAAARLPPGDHRVIGIRSIGTSLSAVVAGALGAPPPVTVRPTGQPFDRRLRLCPKLETEWAAHPGPFVVIDEGPGLSGSSFGAVADALERLGVTPDRIRFLPGHDGDLGPQTSPAHRARWAAAARPSARFDEVIRPELAAAAAAMLGPAVAPLQDISGGAWRDLHPFPKSPPVNAGQERRKLLHRTAEGAWLLKFAGLGRIGRAKLDRARALHAAGFTPEPAGVAHGFLVERWLAGARPARPTLDRLAAYLQFRADHLPADPDAGAPLADLLEMTRANAAEALGPAAGEAVARLAPPDLPALEARVRRVHIDGRLHPWEWLAGPDRRVLKTDALDHSEAHDLIGAQDIAWDIAGAEAELDLTPAETERLRAHLDRPTALLALLRPAYLAFQLGLWTLAAEAQAGWPEEAARTRAQADLYRLKLARVLDIGLSSG